MNLKLNIFSDCSDSYLYMGKLIIVTNNNQLKYINDKVFFAKYLKGKNDFENDVLRKLFFNNKTLESSQRYDHDVQYKTEFDDFWRRKTKKTIEVELLDRDLNDLCKTPEQPVLDFKFYNKRAYIANREGVFECKLEFEEAKVSLISGFNKVFAAKSISLNARMGEVLISSSRDGLFRGSLWTSPSLKVDENPIEKKSVRSSWTNFHFINYENETDSKVFLNKIGEAEMADTRKYLRDDNTAKSYKVEEFAIEKLEVEKSFESQFSEGQVIFSFNSLGRCFFLTNSGDIKASKLNSNHVIDHKKSFFGKLSNWPIKVPVHKLGKPVSSHFVNNGTVFEFYDSVYLLRNGRMEKILSKAVQGVRTFPSSQRYKNIVCLVCEDVINLQSVHPYNK